MFIKIIEYFPDYLLALSGTLLRFFWTTFVETAVYRNNQQVFTLQISAAQGAEDFYTTANNRTRMEPVEVARKLDKITQQVCPFNKGCPLNTYLAVIVFIY